MFEINKDNFGSFVSALRKEKGYSQKELAERLLVSDKAVSKWETGHSLPDITLLIPLAEMLDVTVTELLECRRIENAVDLAPEDVEALVKTAITFSGPDENMKREINRKNVLIYLGAVSVFALEFVFSYMKGFENDVVFLTGGIGLGFGAYFWLFAKDRLPAYYDENKISVFHDGFVRMHTPGVYFNNRNWKYIVKGLRRWSFITAVAYPPLSVLGNLLFKERWSVFEWVLAIPMMVSLFVAIYVPGWKNY